MQGVRGRAAAGGRGRPGEAGRGRGAGRMQSRRGRAARHDSAAGRCPFRGRRGSAEPVGPCGAVSPAGRGGGAPAAGLRERGGAGGHGGSGMGHPLLLLPPPRGRRGRAGRSEPPPPPPGRGLRTPSPRGSGSVSQVFQLGLGWLWLVGRGGAGGMLCGSVGCRANAVKTLRCVSKPAKLQLCGGGEGKGNLVFMMKTEKKKKTPTTPKRSPARQLTLRRSVWHPLKGFWEHPVMRSRAWVCTRAPAWRWCWVKAASHLSVLHYIWRAMYLLAVYRALGAALRAR